MLSRIAPMSPTNAAAANARPTVPIAEISSRISARASCSSSRIRSRASSSRPLMSIGMDVRSSMRFLHFNRDASVAMRLQSHTKGGVSMSLLSWIVLGAFAGWIGSLIVNRTGEGLLRDILLGIVGGLVGGWLFQAMGSTGVTGFNVWSLFVAAIGSVIV